ncbi:MAG: DUF2252 family protein [Planctomycetia bacterium]|nr:MAG: DUF2252 family protein [Planctomycetia bacterium]
MSKSSRPWPRPKRVRRARAAPIACAVCAAVLAAAHAEEARRNPAARLAALNPHLSPDDPRELPMRFRSLNADAYTFFRGTADLYYDWCRENAADWLHREDARLLLHGDVHYGNIGVYRTADSTDFVRFGVVDLDEAFEGPFELDVLRGVASLRVAAAARRIELDEARQTELARRFCAAYAAALRGNLDAATLAERHPAVRALMNKVHDADQRTFARRYLRDGEPPRFAPVRRKKKQPVDILDPAPPATRAALTDALREAIGSMTPASRRLLANDRAMDVRDAARWTRLGSSGSQGVGKYLVLTGGLLRHNAAPMLFEFKEQPRPAAERAGLIRAGPDRGRDVAAAHAALQGPPHWFVSHANLDGRSYLVRPKDPWSEEPDWQDLRGVGDLLAAADLVGETLGHAHRHALVASKFATHPERVAGLAEAGVDEFVRRAAAFEAHLARCFEEFRADPAAQHLALRANEWIARIASPTP